MKRIFVRELEHLPRDRRPDRDYLPFRLQAAGDALRRTVEILVGRVKRVGLQLSKHTAELLFDAIHGMKEIAAIVVSITDETLCDMCASENRASIWPFPTTSIIRSTGM
jgi:hypothetical protein